MNAGHVLRSAVLPLVALVAPLGLMLAPRDQAPVIVLATSAQQAAQAVALADGAILSRFGAFGLVARSEQPGFAARLYSAGAMLVLDAARRGGCLSQSARS